MTIPFITNEKVYPDRIEDFVFDEFDGGINNIVPIASLKPNEAQDILNMSFSGDSGIEKRKGTESFDGLVLNSPILYMDVYKPIDKEEVLIRCTDTDLYADNKKICNVVGKIQGINYIGNYYFLDSEKFYQYNGKRVYEIKPPPEGRLSQQSLVDTKTIVLKEWDMRIKVDMVGQIESIAGTSLFKVKNFNAETKSIETLDPITHAHAQNSFVRLYMPAPNEFVNGVQMVDETLGLKWYEPCDQELDDIWKGENLIPSNCKCIQMDKDRMYVAGSKEHPNEIYLSDINNPMYFPNGLSLQCPPSGDVIQDLVVFDDAIVVGRKNDVHVIYGNTNNIEISGAYYMKRFDTHTGFASINNAREVNNYLFYLGSDMNLYGMHTTQTTNTTLATTIINKDKVSLRKAPFNFTEEDIKDVPAVYFKNEYHMVIKDMVVVYNYFNRAWTRYNGIDATYLLIKGNNLLIGTEDGTTKMLSKVYLDTDKPVKAYYRTGQQSFDKPVNYKNFLDMFAVTHTFDDSDSSVKLLALVDYNEIESEKKIFNELSRFGIAVFGSMLIGSNIAQTDNIPVNLRGRSLSILFSNSEPEEPMKVYQVAINYIYRNVR